MTSTVATANAGAPAVTGGSVVVEGGSGPVEPTERVTVLDVVRGFALFGIILVNWMGPPPAIMNGVNIILFANKFYPIFSFLFGLGFAIQLMRAREAGRPFVLRHLWRLLLLFAIGAAHYTFLYAGDIVHIYAVAGLALLIAVPWNPRVILVVGLLLILIDVSVVNNDPVGEVLYRPDPEVAEQVAAERSEARAEADLLEQKRGGAKILGTYWAWAAAGAREIWSKLPRYATLDWWWDNVFYVGVFLLGLYAGRRRLLHEPERHLRLFRVLLVLGIVIGLPGQLITEYGFPAWLAWLDESLPATVVGLETSRLIFSISRLLLAAGYVAAVVLVFTRTSFGRRGLSPLAPVGRMSLTNYLVQSVFGVILFWPWGLGLDESLVGWPRIAILVAIFAIQVMYSRWWFARFRFGPVEWVWRTLTWLRPQPMRFGSRSALPIESSSHGSRA